MSGKVLFFLIFSYFFFLFCDTQNKYTFNVKTEGIYQIENPYITNDSIIAVTNGNTYIPIIDTLKNKLYLYAKSNSINQLIKSGKSLNDIEFERYSTIDNKRIYKYSIQNSNFDNWFFKILEPNKVNIQYLNLGVLDQRYENCLNLYLYNYKRKDTNEFEILFNDTLTKKYSLRGQGDHLISIDLNKFKGKIKLKFEVMDTKIGLNRFELDINKKRIEYIKDFEKYFIKDTLFYSSNLDFDFYEFDKKKLKKYNTKNKYYYEHKNNTLLIQSKRKKLSNQVFNKIELLKIREIKDVAIGSYIIITNHIFDKYIQKLINTIKEVYCIEDIEVVYVQDIFDNYSYGQNSAVAIKEYLHKIRPKQVLLLGDANVNEENKYNIIPTFYFKQKYKKNRIATDYKYCYYNQMSEIKFYISRLPFKYEQDLISYIYKLEKFIKKYKYKYLIYDDEKFLRNKVYRNKINLNLNYNLDQLDFKSEFICKLNKYNPDIIHYLGHGSFSGWSKKKKVDIDEFSKLKKELTFLLIDQSCWTGDFANLNKDSFIENLLKLNSVGIIGAIASSGFTTVNKNNSFADYFITNKINISNLVHHFFHIKDKLYREGLITYDDLHSFNYFGI